jgi:hypothetical protein
MYGEEWNDGVESRADDSTDGVWKMLRKVRKGREERLCCREERDS